MHLHAPFETTPHMFYYDSNSKSVNSVTLSSEQGPDLILMMCSVILFIYRSVEVLVSLNHGKSYIYSPISIYATTCVSNINSV